MRNCFFLAFAREAKCANMRVADVPEIQKKLVGDEVCNLTTGGKWLLIGSIWTLSGIYQAKLPKLSER